MHSGLGHVLSVILSLSKQKAKKAHLDLALFAKLLYVQMSSSKSFIKFFLKGFVDDYENKLWLIFFLLSFPITQTQLKLTSLVVELTVLNIDELKTCKSRYEALRKYLKRIRLNYTH